MTNQKQGSPLPTFFISHGGGPCFWMDWGPTDPFKGLATYFHSFQSDLQNNFGRQPDAILVISAHWEEEEFTIQTNPTPGMLFDYYGFPEHTYHLNYPAKTSAKLIASVRELFKKSGMALHEDVQRGYDHGVFVPFLLMFPKAEIPVVQLSLKQNLDPAEHIQLGKILEPLRSENILIVGSGLSYHNLRQLNDIHGFSKNFDDWLQETMHKTPAQRTERLIDWLQAPNARLAHPREDHLLPLMVVTGAGSSEAATRTYHEQMSNWKFWTSSFRLG